MITQLSHPKVMNDARLELLGRLEPRDNYNHPFGCFQGWFRLEGTKLVVSKPTGSPVPPTTLFKTILTEYVQTILDDVIFLPGVFEVSRKDVVITNPYHEILLPKAYKYEHPLDREKLEIPLPFNTEEELRQHITDKLLRRIVL